MLDRTVSVIVPTYNAAASLGRCIESALSQDLKPAQVIVINDGSTDDTARVARSYGDRIVYLRQDNKGQGAARNAGLRLAKGRFVAFLDADDYWLPGFLKKCVDFLVARHEAVAANTGFIIKKWGSEYGCHATPDGVSKDDEKGFLLRNFFDFWAKYDHVRTGTVLIRRDVIEQAGYQRDDLRISQDLEYWAYIATFGSWGYVPVPLWVGDSASSAAKGGWIEKYRIRRKLCPTVEQWQERIVPRLRQEDWAGFCVVRGRVAGSFALNKILGGDDVSAKTMVSRYGDEMPYNWSTRLMRLGFKGGMLSWKTACLLIRLREQAKSSFLFAFPNASQRIMSAWKRVKQFCST